MSTNDLNGLNPGDTSKYVSFDGMVWHVFIKGVIYAVSHAEVIKARLEFGKGVAPFAATRVVTRNDMWFVADSNSENVLEWPDGNKYTDEQTACAIAAFWNNDYKIGDLTKSAMNAKHGKSAVFEAQEKYASAKSEREEIDGKAFNGFVLTGMEVAIEMLKVINGIPSAHKWTDLGMARFKVYYAEVVGIWYVHSQSEDDARLAFMNGWESVRVAILTYST